MHSILILSVAPESNQSAWWRVDLGASYDVYSVLIVNDKYRDGTKYREHGLVISTILVILMSHLNTF